MTSSRIAIIVPVYNTAPFLKTCVDSILNQTTKNFLLFLIDDGSTDSSKTICDEYAKRDERIIVLHQKNKGQSAARNIAIDKVLQENLADFVTFVDSDDIIASTYLQELLTGLSLGAEISAIPCLRITDTEAFHENDCKVFWESAQPHEYWLTPGQNRSAAWGKLYPTHYFTTIRFPEGKICEDELTNYKLIFKAKKVAYTSSPLYAYRYRAESTMSSPWSTKRLSRIEAYRDQMRFFNNLGYGDLVADSRKWLIVDLVDAIRNLKKLGNAKKAEELRRELATELKIGKLPFTENYLAYKTAHPLASKLLKLFHLQH